jgi:hypothetical protein
MQCLNPRARQVRDWLVAHAHVSTHGVRVAILKRCHPECFGDGRVNLPDFFDDPTMTDCLIRCWKHELQHARDCLDGIDLPQQEMEKRARKAEFV